MILRYAVNDVQGRLCVRKGTHAVDHHRMLRSPAPFPASQPSVGGASGEGGNGCIPAGDGRWTRCQDTVDCVLARTARTRQLAESPKAPHFVCWRSLTSWICACFPATLCSTPLCPARAAHLGACVYGIRWTVPLRLCPLALPATYYPANPPGGLRVSGTLRLLLVHVEPRSL